MTSTPQSTPCLPIQPGEWKGFVHGHNYGDNDGMNLQQIYEGGEAFES